MKVEIRKQKLSDAEALKELLKDKQVIKQLCGIPFPYTLTRAKKDIQKSRKDWELKKAYFFTILANEKIVGSTVLEKPSKDKKRYELGFWLGRKFWNKGIMTKAVKQTIKFGFEKLKINKIIGDNDIINPASGKVFKKAGFKRIKVDKKKGIVFWEKNLVEIDIKLGKSLTSSEISLMEKSRIKEYGNNRINFRKEKKNIFFFVKEGKEIVAFGMLKPIKIDYSKKDYNILGIGNILSIKKGKGYGKIVMQEILNYLKKKDKTGLGFCGRKNMPFYEKAGFKTKKRLGLKFALRNIKTGEIKGEDPDDVGDGLYYEGKDKLISKMLKTKSIGYYWVPNLEGPHW